MNKVRKLKEYILKIKPREITYFLISCILLALMFSFRLWGKETFDLALGFKNLAITFILVFIALIIHELAHYWFSINAGLLPKYKFSWYTSLIVFSLCLITNGHLVIPITGTNQYIMLKKERIGKFRYGLNYRDLGFISIFALATNLIIGFVLAYINLALNSFWLSMFVKINLLYAVFNFLPVPSADGLYLFYYSRATWAFWFGVFLATALLAGFKSFIAIILIAILLGLVILYLTTKIFQK